MLVYARRMFRDVSAIPILQLLLWCLEDVAGPLTVLFAFVGFLALLGPKLNECIRRLGWIVLFAVCAGEIARKICAPLPGGILIALWGVAALSLGREGREFWADLRNQAILDSDARWTRWIVAAASILLGILLAGDFLLSVVINRPFAAKAWTSLTFGAAAAVTVERLQRSNTKWAQIFQLHPGNAKIFGIGLIYCCDSRDRLAVRFMDCNGLRFA